MTSKQDPKRNNVIALVKALAIFMETMAPVTMQEIKIAVTILQNAKVLTTPERILAIAVAAEEADRGNPHAVVRLTQQEMDVVESIIADIDFYCGDKALPSPPDEP